MYRVSILKIMLCCILIIINGCTPASSSEPLPESDHPYANDFEYTWTIREPGAPQMRLHFEGLEFAKSEGFHLATDKLILLDKYDNELTTYDSYFGIKDQDFWTDWYTGDTLKVKLVTDSSGTDYGFKIDKIETRTDASTSNSSLPESNHPYANNFKHTWTIRGLDATQIRFHFECIQFAKEVDFRRGFDKLILLDKYDNELETYGSYFGTSKQDFWTDWYEGDTLKVKLVTDSSGTDYGFVIDDVETKLDGKIIDINDFKITDPTEIQSPSEDTGISETNALTTIALTSSADSSSLGQSLIFTATVNAKSQGKEKPSGTVTFMDEATPIETKALSSGQATLTTSALSAGSHSITAKYNGDNNFKSSTSSPLTLTIPEPSTEEQSDTEQNSIYRDIIATISQNTLVSGIIVTVVGGIIVVIIENKYFY